MKKKRNVFISFIYLLGWNNFQKRRKKTDLNIKSLILEPAELSILKILENFIEKIIHNDLRNIYFKYDSVFEIKKYIKISKRNERENYKQSIKYLARAACVAVAGLISLLILYSKNALSVLSGFQYFFMVFSVLIIFLFINSFLFLFITVFWQYRIANYHRISFVLQQSIKDKTLIDTCVHDLCQYPKDNIQEAEKIIGNALKKMERESDSNLELAPILSAVVVIILLLSGFKSILLGVAGVLAVGVAGAIAFFRWLNRRNKNFQINCLEQLVFLLELAQDKLDSKEKLLSNGLKNKVD